MQRCIALRRAVRSCRAHRIHVLIRDAGHATVAPPSQGLRAQAPSPSVTEGTHDFVVLGFEETGSGEHAASPSDDIHPSAAIFALGATPMDGWHLALFLIATYFGGLTSGLSGFAMGLVVSGVWLHLVTPQQNALLIVLCGRRYARVRHLARASRDKLADRRALHRRRRGRHSGRHRLADDGRSGHNCALASACCCWLTAFTACSGRPSNRPRRAFRLTLASASSMA